MAQLQGCYVASLGRTLREGGPALAAAGPLRWWWVGGLFAAVVLALRALELGPGYSWLTFAVAVTALPVGAAGVAWPAGRRRIVLARRLARRSAHLVAAGGADARAQERLDGLWRLAGRLQGPTGQQLHELEAYCREQAWRPAAQFYADQLEALGAAAGTEGGRRSGWRRRLAPWRRRSRERSPLYAVREMRAW